uniref:NADH-ubiquinone oxidoreductase chain 6 n=1 Tax=Staphylinoidea sp. 4 KM-2017 TaxID=2219458 RepID=A0A346RFE6_9COLE|nr:NADH dehydrogenase subunit 6 [Staphylinoidea sp. 4 KM-2017]
MMLILINLLLSTMFLFMNHPMTVGTLLLLQSIIISLITGLLNNNFWFSYILFLIMVGGMLVLFIYMTSIASNEMFNYSNKMMISFFSLLMLMILLLILTDKYFINYNFFYKENIMFMNYPMSLIKYYTFPSTYIIMMLMIYLFITLIATVKITNLKYGPLRSKT